MTEQTLTNAAPSRLARVVTFLAILLAGACGGLIGYTVTDLQCNEGCSGAAALGAVIGAVAAATGVAVVAVLTLRAMAEWKAIEERDRRIAASPDAGPDDL